MRGKELIQIITMLSGNANILQAASNQHSVTTIQCRIVFYTVYTDIYTVAKATGGFVEEGDVPVCTLAKDPDHNFCFFGSQFFFERHAGVWVVVSNCSLLVTTTP